MHRHANLIAWILTVPLAALMGVAGAGKFGGGQMVVDQFDAWGYPEWFPMLIGAAELAGAIGLLIPRLATLASIGLIIVMGGAAWTHLNTEGEMLRTLIPVGVMVALAIVGWLRWSRSPFGGGTAATTDA